MVRTHLSGHARSEIYRHGCYTARLAQACLLHVYPHAALIGKAGGLMSTNKLDRVHDADAPGARGARPEHCTGAVAVSAVAVAVAVAGTACPELHGTTRSVQVWPSRRHAQHSTAIDI